MSPAEDTALLQHVAAGWVLCCYGAIQTVFITSPGQADFIPSRSLTGNFTSRLPLIPALPSEQPVNWQCGYTHFPGVPGQVYTWQVSLHSTSTGKSPPEGLREPRHSQSFSLPICLCCKEAMPDVPLVRIFSRSVAQNTLTVWHSHFYIF